MRGSLIYSSGTGKTEIAFECARRAAAAGAVFAKNNTRAGEEQSLCTRRFDILLVVPRIVLVSQNLKRLINYQIRQDRIGVYFGEKKEINKEITIITYQS